MKIFIAGATGAIGKPLVSKLLQENHSVFGMTHSKDGEKRLSDLGATALFVDALNAEDVKQAVQKTKPEIIIDMLTALPKVYTTEAMKNAAAYDTKLRREGGAHLLKAGRSAGTRRYIMQSSAFWYAQGDGLATEETPFASNATPGIAAGVKVYIELEQRILQADFIEGVALRFGFFYGPGTWFSKTGSVADLVRKKEYYIVENGHGMWNFVHVEDAAQAIVSALTCKPGAYNITGDVPVEMSDFLPAFAHFIGAPLPPSRSVEEETRMNGADSAYYATSLRGASNAKAKRELGFKPRVFEWRE